VGIKNIKSNAPYPNKWRWQVFFRLNWIGKSVSIWMEIQLKELILIPTNWDACTKTPSVNAVYLNIIIIVIIIIMSITWRSIYIMCHSQGSVRLIRAVHKLNHWTVNAVSLTRSLRFRYPPNAVDSYSYWRLGVQRTQQTRVCRSLECFTQSSYAPPKRGRKFARVFITDMPDILWHKVWSPLFYVNTCEEGSAGARVKQSESLHL